MSERSIVVKIPEEDHTLGTMLSSVLWSHPHVVVAQYAQKHPVNREEISLHCQTDNQITASASLKEAVHTTKSILGAIDDELSRALAEFSEHTQ